MAAEKAAQTDDRTERVTLITGASSGIGEACARHFARRGDRVVLAARRQDRLRRLATAIEAQGGHALVLEADLARPDAGDALIEQTERHFGRLDVLVNNAGFGLQAWYQETPWPDVECMFRVNVLAAMQLSQGAIALMRRGGGGSIVNVASVGGLVAHPLNVAYCASKHAVVGFSKALALELQGTGIRVVVVCPGATRTEFFDRAKRDIPFASFIEANMVPPDKVADAIVRATTSHRHVLFPNVGAWFLCWADRWLPSLSRRGNVAYRDRVLAARRPAR